jgi:hypothetical protein
MKTIRPNDIKLNKLDKKKLSDLSTSVQQAIQELIKVDEKSLQFSKLDSNPTDDDQILLKSFINPFIEAIHMAYEYHLPLDLTPDQVWYVIASQFATHINQNSEELRSNFVNHDGKKRILIRRDDFVYGSNNNPWDQIIDQFSFKIAELTKNEVAELMTSNFSTTTPTTRVVSQIVLMDAMQKYFGYHFCTMCGIPEIRLHGNKQDWEAVQQKTLKMLDLIPELKEVWWKNGGLEEILQNFVHAFDNKVDEKFWNEIYKVGGGSGGPYLSGWATALFLYLKDGHKNRYVWKENWKNLYSSNQMFSGLTTADFIYYMNQVPFIWEYFGDQKDMLFVGGFAGVLYNKSKASVSPVFAYGVSEANANYGQQS